jgi:RNA polymerase primary sigma factor
MAGKNETKTTGRPDEPKVLSVDDQNTLIKDEIDRFIRMSREKGFITVEEINDLMPPC